MFEYVKVGWKKRGDVEVGGAWVCERGGCRLGTLMRRRWETGDLAKWRAPKRGAMAQGGPGRLWRKGVSLIGTSGSCYTDTYVNSAIL